MQVQDSELQGQGAQRDLLSLLLEEKREDGTPAFSQREVHDEVIPHPLSEPLIQSPVEWSWRGLFFGRYHEMRIHRFWEDSGTGTGP